MSSRSLIQCSCGRQIEAHEVLKQGYFMSQWKPMWVYVKYRCSRCRMLGEKLVDYAQWDGPLPGSEPTEPGEHEQPAVPATGQIDDAEISAFADRLRTLEHSDLDRLAGTVSLDHPER